MNTVKPGCMSKSKGTKEVKGNKGGQRELRRSKVTKEIRFKQVSLYM